VQVNKPESLPKKDKYAQKIRKMVAEMREDHRLRNERYAEQLRLLDEEIEEEMRQFTADLEKKSL
jgi:hypothetical protein